MNKGVAMRTNWVYNTGGVIHSPLLLLSFVRQAVYGLPQLFRRRMSYINDPADVERLLRAAVKGAEVESFWVVCLDVDRRLIAVDRLSEGTVDRVRVDLKDVFRVVLNRGASAIIVAHNHPSGDLMPGELDIEATRLIRQAGKLLGVYVLDHVILGGEGRYISMRDMPLTWDSTAAEDCAGRKD